MAGKTRRTRKAKPETGAEEPFNPVIAEPAEEAAKAGTGELAGMEGPGVGRVSIPEIDTLANAYVKVRDKRMELTDSETEAKADLMTAMERHSLEDYRYSDANDIQRLVSVVTKDKTVKVRKLEDDLSVG